MFFRRPSSCEDATGSRWVTAVCPAGREGGAKHGGFPSLVAWKIGLPFAQVPPFDSERMKNAVNRGGDRADMTAYDEESANIPKVGLGFFEE